VNSSEKEGGEGDAWRIVALWQRYDGELRAAVLRICAVAVLYACQLLLFQWAEASEEAKTFHRIATWACLAWSAASLLAIFAVQAKLAFRLLPYATTLADLGLLTLVAAAGSKTQSPVVVGYFLIILVSAQRFDLPLIWTSTLGSVACYLLLVGLADPKWFDADHATPLIQQFVMYAALLLCGAMTGQLVRRARPLAIEYHRRAAGREEK